MESSKFENENASGNYRGQGKRHLRHRIQQLQVQNDQQAMLISKLRSDMAKEVQKGKEIKQSVDKMVDRVNNKELLLGRQNSDEDIHCRFRSLISQIRTWSVPFAQVRQNAQDYSVEAIEKFRQVAPDVSDLQNFLQTPRNLRLLVRGCVGLAIAESFFRTIPYGPDSSPYGEDVWMDRELAQGFASIENSLFHSGKNSRVFDYFVTSLIHLDRTVISYHELHDWRALTATRISRPDTYHKTREGREKDIIACSTRIMSLVANWVTAEDQGKFEDRLRKILSDAVELSQTLRCQRAFWSIRQAGSFVDRTGNAECAHSLLYFDEGTMDDIDGDDDSDDSDERSTPTSSPKIVEIIISPSLWKRGNTDGERYDSEFCAARSDVKCKEAVFSP